MKRLDFMEGYFVKLHKRFGITKLNYEKGNLDLDDKSLRNMIFVSENFNDEFDKLLKNCKLVYSKLKRGFSIKIKKDDNNNYFVLLM